MATLQQLIQSANRRYMAIVGRVLTYLKNPDMGTLPVSCTVHVPKFTSEGIKFLIGYTSYALRTGAGINIHLDNFQASNPHKGQPLASIKFIINFEHPEANSPEFYKSGIPSGYQIRYVSDSMTQPGEFWYADCIPEGVPVSSFKSIEDSIYQAYEDGLNNNWVAYDMSALRPDNVENPLGMVSSGAASFTLILAKAYEFGQHQSIESLLAFLSSFNATLRRGGVYKNGAITTSLPIWHPEAKAYLETPKEIYPWLKQGLVLPSNYQEFAELLPLVYQKVNIGALWLEKAVIQMPIGYEWLDSTSPRLSQRLRANVCREIQIPDLATCNLGHLNAGQIASFQELPTALCYVTQVLCELHSTAPQDGSGYYLPASKDRQIGVGILGLANLLAIHKISYREHITALDALISYFGEDLIWEVSKGFAELPTLDSLPQVNLSQVKASYELAWWLIKAYTEAARIGYGYNMFRVFTIAPTANSSFRYEDLEFFTTTPEISPPLAHEIERVSETQEETDTFFYHPNCELAVEVGWHWYRELVDTYQRLMNATGLGHSISFNIWEDIDDSFMEWWASSHVLTTYYRLDVDQSSLNKANQFEPIGGSIKCACAG